MLKNIARLRKVIPPPNQPKYINTNWTEVEETLGWRLPLDYKQLFELYGSGGFYPQELFVWNLCYSYPPHDQIVESIKFSEDVNDGTPICESLKGASVFLWGQDGIGQKYFWAQDGDPDDWYVFVTQGRLDYIRFPGLSLSDLLVEFLVERNIALTSILCDEDETLPCHFRPSD